MGWFVKFMFLAGIVCSVVLLIFSFSDTVKAVLISLVAGIIVFLLFNLILELRNYISLAGNRKRDKLWAERINKRKRRDNLIGFLILIIATVIFFNSYLYVKALLGNDMLISLKVNQENFVLNNGGEGQLNVKAKVLVNPFCSANCSLSLEDLSNEEIVDFDNIYIKFSSPFSKDYIIGSNNEKFGQNLYKVSLECDTIKNRFCYTSSNVSKSRTDIISVNYELNDTQEARKEELKNETEDLNKEIYAIKYYLTKLDLNFSSLNLSEFENESKYLYNLSVSITNETENLNLLYENQEYSKLEAKISSVKENVQNIERNFSELNYSVMQNIMTYNSLVDNASLMYDEILYLENYNFSDSSVLYARAFILDFNSMVLALGENNKIENKTILFNNLKSEKENLFSILKNESDYNVSANYILGVTIHPVNASKILINNETYNFSFILDEPSPVCCFRNECYKCINDPSSNYPVILVHGHSFNEKLSAELSLEAFSEMASALEKDGYLNAGYFYGSQYDEFAKGYLGKINSSVAVEATYYLNTLETQEGSFIFDSKEEDIDTYAGRLNEVISNVKYLTGKNKVILVAHSMGGLVTRRYLQLYGDQDIAKVVLVGSPNKGVDGFVLTYCPILGADIECSEMNKSSSFLAELNNASLPDIPIYNIIGMGCLWEGSQGDGIVKSESAYLEGADNIYVTGTCSGVDFFHVNMIKPSKYPEIYTLIKGLIKE
jgi:hypothetical protein